MNQNNQVLFDAGLFIGALLSGDVRHAEARPLASVGWVGVSLQPTVTLEKWCNEVPTHPTHGLVFIL